MNNTVTYFLHFTAACNFDGGDCCLDDADKESSCYGSNCDCKENINAGTNTNSGSTDITNTDNRNTIQTESYIFPVNRTQCENCNCGVAKNGSVQFVECDQTHKYICEYKVE